MASAPIDPLIGRKVAQYEIAAKLGGGGMGVVYQARDTKLGRTVALKFLPRQWSHDEGARQRFLREAQAASAANHRNICTIHDIVQTDDEQLFIVMAHYEGPTLKQKLEGGALPLDHALQIATEIAEGLAKAHSQGVVHRDIKAGNLILTDDGVKILDFGLAKFADALQLTLPGTTVGTVAYMSPEQARGEEADELSDVWAAGVVLYEMLTGEVPFKGSHSEATLYAIKTEPTPSLSTPGREIPESVARIVSLALQKERVNRYQSAREMARDLRMIQGLSVPLDLRTAAVPVQTSPLPKRRPWWRRALTPARVAVTIAAVLTAGGGLYIWTIWPVERIPVAIAPVANHTGEPALDDYRLAMTAALVEELSESPNIRVASYLRILEMLRRFISGAGDISSRDAIHAIATQSGARFVIVPALEYRNGAWLAQAEVRSVETGTSVTTLETETLASSLPKETAYRLMGSLAAGVQGHFKVSWPHRAPAARPAGSRFRSLDAARAFEQGLNAYGQMEYAAAKHALTLAATEDPQRAIVQAWLSRVALMAGQNSEAIGAGQRARQFVSQQATRAEVLFIEATLAESQRDIAAAEKHHRALIGDRPDDPAAHAELADFLKRQYRDQEAVEAYHEVLRLDVGHIRPHVELCQLYTRLNDHPLAEQQAQTALERYRAAGDRSGEAQALLCLGEVQRVEQGAHLAEARRNIESARDIFESLGQQYGLSRAYQYLGLIAASERNYRAAVESWEEALSRSRQVGDRALEGTLLMNVGLAHLRLGQRRQALNYLDESREFYEQIGEARRAAEAEVNLAALLVDHGGEQSEVLRHVSNAQSTFRKLGQVDFDLAAMEVAATSYRYAGQLDESVRQLNQALNVAKERQLRNRIESVSVNIAQSRFLLNEYEAARTLLEEVVASDAGRDDLEAHIALGRVYVRLGDFEAARKHLERALAGTEAGGQMTLAALTHAASGELAYESGKLQEARGHFDRAASFWTEDLPDAASVEARCYEGLLDTPTGKIPAVRRIVELSAAQARKMGRLHLEARCRLALARIHLIERRDSEAVATLDQVASGGDRIGPELQAEMHYWRGRALAARGDRAAADSEIALARKLAQELRASLPEQQRDRFVSRTTIRLLIE